MLCVRVGKPSTYFTVSPVTGAGVTPPILDPGCWSPWLGAPFPCLAFLWSPRGCTPPPSVHTAGGTAWGETSGKLQAPIRVEAALTPSSQPSLLLPSLCYHPPAQGVFPLARGTYLSFHRKRFFFFLEGYPQLSLS